MDRYKETFETWNKVASLYQEKFMNLDLYNETYDFICSYSPIKKSQILEIGCGPGNISKYLLSKRPDFEVFGIDIAPNMIELAKRNNPMAHFEIMDCREISKIKTKYDGIICGFCLPYLSFEECKKLIVDTSILLNKNGLIYLSFVEGEENKSGFQISSTGDRTYFNYHNLEIIKSQLSENSFEELKTFKVLYKKSETQEEIHTILVAAKS